MRRGALTGVIGWPVHQSLSPHMHSYWLRQHGVAGAYVALPVQPEDFGQVVAILPRMGFVGANVTVPHKAAAFALCAELDEDAKATGAVNTLIFKNDAVRGLNGDVRGFAASLTAAFGKEKPKAGAAVVLGAGGAARAVVLALSRADAPEIRLLNRTRKRAEQVAAAFANRIAVRVLDWGDFRAAFADASLLINTTSLGMLGKGGLALPLAALPSTAGVADIVYNPLETPLLRDARARGHPVMDGLGMLLHQGAIAFAAWYGVAPAITAGLRQELETALRCA